jgi:hypothetical protein
MLQYLIRFNDTAFVTGYFVQTVPHVMMSCLISMPIRDSLRLAFNQPFTIRGF